MADGDGGIKGSTVILDKGNDVLNEVSKYTMPPYYLCYSDIFIEVLFSSIVGYTFVFMTLMALCNSCMEWPISFWWHDH
jgi:hypothetical protein